MKKKFTRHKERIISVQEMNKRIAYCVKYKVIHTNEEVQNISIFNAYIEDRRVWFRLTYDDGTGPCTYMLRKDLIEYNHSIRGMDAYTILCRYWKPPVADAPFSASPYLWKSEAHNNTRNHAWGYDLNSAYSTALIGDDFPDTSKDPMPKLVGKGEIGFDGDGFIVRQGFALFVFKTMKSPLKRFVEKYYRIKTTTHDAALKQKAKDVMNMAIGYLQNINPFIRAYVVGKCTELIESLIDENTIYCNTDSIVSLKPREDLKLGDGIGEWKLEHEGEFAYKEYNYQWDREPPAFRGVPKSWFKRGFDILKDPIPEYGNVYKYDYQRMRLVKERIK